MSAQSLSGFETGPYVSLNGLIRIQALASAALTRPSRKKVSMQSGGHLSHQRGRGMEFAEVRPYIPGDDIRAMDWKVTARTGKAHTKLFHEEKERQVIIACDQSRSLFFGSRMRTKSSCAAQLAALLGWSALANKDRVGALLFNDQEEYDFRPTNRPRGFLTILNQLHALNQQAGELPLQATCWSTRLQHLYRVLKPGSHAIWISDLYGYTPAAHHWLSLIRRHSDLSVIIVQDPLETELPQAGSLAFTNGIEQVSINTHSGDVREAYHDSVASLYEALNQTTLALGISLMTIKTDDDLLSALRSKNSQPIPTKA